MLTLRLLLLAMFISVVTYTAIVVQQYGFGFAPIFFGEIRQMTWAGQFNLDFLFLLALGAWWVAWRHRFSVAGCGLALTALVGGVPFYCIYLWVLSGQHGGDVGHLLLGPRHPAAQSTAR
jgi:hypothetical protein